MPHIWQHRCGKLPGGLLCWGAILYISKTWKIARDQQTEKFAGSFRLTYACTFSLTFFARGKCGNRCLTRLPLCIDWKQQEQEDEMGSSSSLVLTLWRTTDGQRSEIGFSELPSKTERGVGFFFFLCADATLQHQQSASPPDICQIQRGTSYFHQELWWLRWTAALEICWAEKKVTNRSSCRASEHLPSLWVRRHEVNTGYCCWHISVVNVAGTRRRLPPSQIHPSDPCTALNLMALVDSRSPLAYSGMENCISLVMCARIEVLIWADPTVQLNPRDFCVWNPAHWSWKASVWVVLSTS